MVKKIIEVYVHRQSNIEPVFLSVQEDATVQNLIDAALKAGLLAVKDNFNIHVFAQDGDMPLELSEKIAAKGIKHKQHVHIHHCQKIIVSVIYNGQTKQKEFSPATKIRRVLDWATKEFGLSAVDASDKVLRLPDGTETSDLDSHLGSYTQLSTCSVNFNLTPAAVVQG